MNRRQFILGAGATALAATAVGSTVLAHEIGTHRLRERFVRLSIGLTRPLRVAALGDIHFDPRYEEEYLADVMARLNALTADLILYTGDFVTRTTQRMDDLARILATGNARLGSFAALGNHDHWSGAGAVVRSLDRQGIRVLRNACYKLPEQELAYLSALDSYWGGHPNPTVLAQTPANSRHILLVHEPDPFQFLNDPRIALQISGHTHGGQVRLPALGALILPSYGRLFQEGLYTLNGRRLYVNPGIGTLSPHVRINCPPEITVFELT